MTSLTDRTDLVDLREVVDVVIGVDTHVHTHTAAVIDARTGGVLEEPTVAAAGGARTPVVRAGHRCPAPLADIGAPRQGCGPTSGLLAGSGARDLLVWRVRGDEVGGAVVLDEVESVG